MVEFWAHKPKPKLEVGRGCQGSEDRKNGFAVFVERLDVDDREGKIAEDGCS